MHAPTLFSRLRILVLLLCIAAVPWFHFRWRFLPSLQSYTRFSDSSSPDINFPGLTPEEVVSLGWAAREDAPGSSYVHFLKPKDQGKIRIGLFGDSLIAGNEVGPQHDIASFLSHEIKRAGITTAEVINFGVGAYGVGQAYLLWNILHQRLELDIAALFPMQFHRQRDTTFLFSAENFGPVHGRFIESAEGATFLKPPGASRFEASAKYYSTLPLWEYLRYDFRIPPFIRSLLPEVWANRANPFYYRPMVFFPDETTPIYKALFSSFTAPSETNMVVSSDSYFDSFREDPRFAGPLVSSEIMRHIEQFPYFAPLSHRSAFGNRLRAQELFCILMGKTQFAYDFIDVEVKRGAEKPSVSAEALQSCAQIEAVVGDKPLATFVRSSLTGSDWQYDRRFDFSSLQLGSLVLLSTKSMRFFRSGQDCSSGCGLTLRVSTRAKEADFSLGSVQSLFPGMATGNDSTVRTQSDPDSTIRIVSHNRELDDVRIESSEEVEGATLQIGSNEQVPGVLSTPPHSEGRYSYSVSFPSPLDRRVMLRVPEGVYLPPEELGVRGNIDLVCLRTGAPELRFPFATYSVGQRLLPVPEQPRIAKKFGHKRE
jgi:hypothetical protein